MTKLSPEAEKAFQEFMDATIAYAKDRSETNLDRFAVAIEHAEPFAKSKA